MSNLKALLLRWLPPVAGVGLIWLFVSLAGWQLDRAAGKEALAALFEAPGDYVEYSPNADYTPYQRVSVHGRYLADRQVLIDNIVSHGQLGYYVITPLEREPGVALLLVNRGWLPRRAGGEPRPGIAVGNEPRLVEGRVGRLPRVALRPEHAITPGQSWPQVAVYPQLADIEGVLGKPVAGPVLLLAPDADDGYRRDWRPEQAGPMMHYGYAFQWSALAVTVFAVLVWHTRKRYRHE